MVIFIVWIVFIRLEQQTNLNHKKEVSKSKYFCPVAMSCEDTKILQFNQYQKSSKTLSIICADFESLKKMDYCNNNLEKLSTAKAGEHVSSVSFNVYNIIIWTHKR